MSFAKSIVIILSLLILTSTVRAHDVRVMAHQIPPFGLHDNKGKVTGFSAELFQLVYEGIHQQSYEKIIPATFKRLYAEIQHPNRSIGITIGRNAKREKLVKWVGPYATVNLAVVARKDRYIRINELNDFAGYKIATIENTAPEQALLKRGLSKNFLIPDLYPKRNIQKLASGRVDMFAYPLEGTSYLMKVNNIPASEFEEVYSLKQIDIYFAFSKDFSDDEIAMYQTELDRVLGSPEFEVLRDKYAMDDIQKLRAN